MAAFYAALSKPGRLQEYYERHLPKKAFLGVSNDALNYAALTHFEDEASAHGITWRADTARSYWRKFENPKRSQMQDGDFVWLRSNEYEYYKLIYPIMLGLQARHASGQ